MIFTYNEVVESLLDNPLANELLQMAEVDQAMRTRAVEDKSVWDSSIDEENTKRLKDIVREKGWPSIPMVGEQASQAAWLLIQHADSLGFMEHCLELMKALPKGAVSPANIAYLEDRVLMMNEKPQIYGTQFQGIGQDLEVYPIEDPQHVNERRASVGLGVFEENENRIRGLYGKTKQD